MNETNGPWVAVVAKLGAAALGIIALCSARWGLVDGRPIAPSWSSWGGAMTYGAILLTVITSLGLSVFRNRYLAFIAVASAVVAMVAAAAFMLLQDGWGPDSYGEVHVVGHVVTVAVGPAFVVALLASFLAIIGVGLSPAPPRAGDEVGELRDGKRHGRWLIYRNGVVCEMRDYDRGELVKTSPYPPPA